MRSTLFTVCLLSILLAGAACSKKATEDAGAPTVLGSGTGKFIRLGTGVRNDILLRGRPVAAVAREIAESVDTLLERQPGGTRRSV